MTSTRIGLITLAAAASIAAIPTQTLAQHHSYPGHPDLHINPRWSECSFQLSSALTQSTFRQFSGEAGVVTYFRPLADARPIGRGKFDVSIVQWETGIDHHDDAWNDTFVHPDSVHYLFEGSRLKFPGLIARMGVNSRTDAGFYITKAPGANYGFVGGMVQYNVLNDAESNWALSTRWSTVSMYGPEDLEFSVYGADVVASRSYAVRRGVTVSPYAIVSGSLSRAQEKSAVVDLDDENVFGGQATLGAVAQIGGAKVGFEYAVARVNSLSLRIGFGAK
jgi:hypothetical protein